jgi:glutamyl-tRNA synthetase
MDTPVRVRFAPSPTGFPHVGNIRVALFDWLWARHTGGKFIVRIEDTDVARTVPGSVESILDSLRWLGLDWDEGPEVGGEHGPYFQSQRLPIYQEIAERLVKEDKAYYCYCSSERLEAMRAEQAKMKLSLGYDRYCRYISDAEKAEMLAKGIKPVVRFKTPIDGQTRFQDLLRGEVIFENSTIDDFVMLKSDGYPTYQMANVIDDHLMEISHVLRGEEWLSSTPRHIMLYNALGYQTPQFAHLPLILGPDRSKLSKRHGASTVAEYREQGYLPETMFNFLALLGWSLDEKTELFTREELIKNFSIERISRTAGIFNREKLDWMNGMYIRSLSVDDLTGRVLPFLEKGLPPEIPRPLDISYVRQIVPLIRERIITLKDAATYADFFFLDKLEYDSAMLIGKKMTAEIALTALKGAENKISSMESFSTDLLEEALRHLADDLGIKTGQLFNALRVAITARDAAPPLFETMAVLGRERCLKRISAALIKLTNDCFEQK